MRYRSLLVAPFALLLLLGADRAADRLGRTNHDHGSHRPGAVDRRAGARLLPALRGLLVQVWLVRINADLAAGRLHQALRHAREALAMAPDLPRVRVRLSDVLAYDLPPYETDPARRLAWIAEGIQVLDEGLAEDPYDALLHEQRGLLIWSRGSYYAEFEQAFRRTQGRTTLEAGVDALVSGAEYSRDSWQPVRAATIGLARRGDWYLDLAPRDAVDPLRAARADFAAAASYLRELLEFSGYAQGALRVDLGMAETGGALADLLEAERDGAVLDLAPVLGAIGRTFEAVAESTSVEAAARSRLAEILTRLLPPHAGDESERVRLVLAGLAVVEAGLARDPASDLLAEAKPPARLAALELRDELEQRQRSGEPVDERFLAELSERLARF